MFDFIDEEDKVCNQVVGLAIEVDDKWNLTCGSLKKTVIQSNFVVLYKARSAEFRQRDGGQHDVPKRNVGLNPIQHTKFILKL